MRLLRLWLWGFLALLTLIWVFAEVPFATPDPASVREKSILLTGVLAMGVMSFAMVLATRPVWIEPWLGGLDKSYRLHKWLGIAALVLATIHWFAVNGLGAMLGEDGHAASGGHLPSDHSELPPLQQWFATQTEIAGPLGHVLFYIVVVLIALALIKRFPYRRFAKTHKILAVVYLIYVYHSVVLMEFGYWQQPVGILSAVLMAAGTIAATLALTGQIGRNRRVKGVIEEIDLFPQLGVMETAIRLQDGWKRHQGGQFAFVTFDTKEGAHPFTIGSAWNPDNPHINFITKGLGDYTELMADKLRVGDTVTVEGPYGRFTFADDKERQIWVGAGIGVTPFIARMKQLAREPRNQIIDLFVVGPVDDPTVRQKFVADAKASGVRLHFIIDGRDERLTGKGLRERIPGWKDASIWFCGPAKFGESVKQDLVANGLAASDFHQELFNMR